MWDHFIINRIVHDLLLESGGRNRVTIWIFNSQLRNFLIIPIQVVGSRDGPGSNPTKYSRMLMSYGAKVDGYAPYDTFDLEDSPKELYSAFQLATLQIDRTDTELFDALLGNDTSLYGSLVTLLENPSFRIQLKGPRTGW